MADFYVPREFEEWKREEWKRATAPLSFLSKTTRQTKTTEVPRHALGCILSHSSLAGLYHPMAKDEWQKSQSELGPTTLNPAIPFFFLDLDAGFFGRIRGRNLEEHFKFLHRYAFG